MTRVYLSRTGDEEIFFGTRMSQFMRSTGSKRPTALMAVGHSHYGEVLCAGDLGCHRLVEPIEEAGARAAMHSVHSEEDLVSWAVRRAPEVLGRYLITDVVELWETLPMARSVPFCASAVSMVHYLGLLGPIMAAHLRVPIHECAVTDPLGSVCVWNGRMECTTEFMFMFVIVDLLALAAIYMYKSMDTARRRLIVIVISLTYHTMPFAGVVINSQVRAPVMLVSL